MSPKHWVLIFIPRRTQYVDIGNVVLNQHQEINLQCIWDTRSRSIMVPRPAANPPQHPRLPHGFCTSQQLYPSSYHLKPFGTIYLREKHNCPVFITGLSDLLSTALFWVRDSRYFFGLGFMFGLPASKLSHNRESTTNASTSTFPHNYDYIDCKVDI